MSKLGKEGHNGHFRICLNENNAKKKLQCRLFKKRKRGSGWRTKRKGAAVCDF